MEENYEIDEYISKMLLDCKWSDHAELITFSELYNVQIQLFDPFRLNEPIARISTAEGENIISLLFSGDHMIV